MSPTRERSSFSPEAAGWPPAGSGQGMLGSAGSMAAPGGQGVTPAPAISTLYSPVQVTESQLPCVRNSDNNNVSFPGCEDGTHSDGWGLELRLAC